MVTSTISNLQQALNCAGKCDCCNQLQAQINELKNQIAKLPKIDENRIIATTKASLQPDISTAVAAGAVVITNQLKPQIESAAKKASDAFLEIARNTERLRLTEIEAKGASSTATRAEKNAAEYARQMQAEQQARIKLEGETARIGRENKKIELSTEELKRLETTNRREAERLAQIERKSTSRIAQIEAEIPPIKSSVNTVRADAKNAASKATEALADAGKASKQALNAASEVTGLKGVVNGVKGTLGKLGDSVVAVEKSIGDAITKAAKAVGVSSDALAATARLGGKVLDIFNVLGTVFSILDGMATREVLGARLDAVERGLSSVGNDVSKSLGSIFQLKNRVSANELDINYVRALAGDARGLSLQATSLAQSAQITGNNAQSTASVAQGTALQSQATADGAVRNAKQANDNATTAYTRALESANVATSASTKADTATKTATTADTKATASQKTATEANTNAKKATDFVGQAITKAGEALLAVATIYTIVQSLRLLRGLPGLPGLPGRNGLNGRDGITTVVTLPGKQGDRGFPGISGLPGKNGRHGVDAVPYNDSGLRAFIAAQHAGTRTNSTAQHTATRVTILTPIMAALAPILALLKQIYDAIMAASNAAILALLQIINLKLGEQLIGGIAGKLTRFTDWLQLDRALNLMILAATIHNALMLSNDIGQTLMGAINNILQLIGLKKEDGSAFDIGSVISGSIENLIKSTIGEDNYTELKEAWSKANRIYQATTNVINSFLNLSQVILQASELIAAYTGKIGNALRKGGVVLESAYGWLNPQPKFNRVTQTLESLQNGASTIQMVTQAPLDVVNAVTESTTAATEFVKAVKEDEKPINKAVEIPEPNELKAKETQIKTASQPLNFDFSDLFDGED